MAALVPAQAQEAAQAFPRKPITLVVPFSPGSGTDQQARVLAQALSEDTGQPVLVENRAGASGFIAAQHVAKATADGYTVLITTNTTQAANEFLFKKLPYDPVADFAPVGLLSKGQMLLLVRQDSPYKTLADLIATAQKHPGKLNFGSGSSSSRVAGELLKQLAGLDMVDVAYKSNPMAITDLMGGQLDFMFADAPTALPQVEGGRLRALAASGSQRLGAAPQIPTLDESGVKGYEMTYWTGAYLPAATPRPLVERLNQLLAKASASAEVKSFQLKASGETALSSPEGLARFQAAESRKWGRIIREAGIKPE
nr:tripartite tricarboxylate transporter substrate binding protein [Comamonas testosteroni]